MQFFDKNFCKKSILKSPFDFCRKKKKFGELRQRLAGRLGASRPYKMNGKKGAFARAFPIRGKVRISKRPFKG